ncbi:hypothetical protein SEA_WYBORN_49 [Arthrobacter phage Wyborn]|uniref:Uncharacterized protein n=1 Tax=Arthrobacter phage Wyborn TaxID=3059067 RepID=A0AA96GR30_9CAUD|nr:hypothetical protein SEA_WYBORN_49 [Arthrobacter phage Wyborn]
MNGDAAEQPVEWAEWPPPLASRPQRRDCARRRHEQMIKGGYCVLCGTKVSS